MRRPTTSTPAGLRRAIAESVDAARAEDADRFAEAATRLAAQDPQRLVLVQSGVIRSLLEDLHPDGLSGADAQDLLRRCLTWAVSWYPRADPRVLVLTGALGLDDGGTAPAASDDAAEPAASEDSGEVGPVSAAPDPVAPSEGAALLIADLLSAAGAPLTGYLDAALAELERAETIELP
ncbi:MAG: hypothetical protein JO144_16410 [Actinobacteria bacterium]|nr:hypothetical protein [Actinomycetota bacterium]